MFKLNQKPFSSKKPTSGQKELPRKNGWRRYLARIIIAALIFFYLFIGWLNLSSGQKPGAQISFSELISKIQEEQVEKIVVFDTYLKVYLKADQSAFVEREPGTSFIQALKDSGLDPQKVNFEFSNQNLTKAIGNAIAALGPIVLTGLLFWYLFKQAGKAQSSIFSFTKSKAKFFSKGKQSITFNDVAGLEEAKEELKEVVDFLKNPQKYRRVGARPPKGVLLVGPSGTGKTLLARAIAGEAGVPFFSMAGSEFMEILVGVGAGRVRDLFATAKKASPSVIFIDEIDAIGRARGLGGFGGGHDEREQTLNQILVEMDGFEPTERVTVIAATNRPDLLDPALLRPGRFDRRITLGLPDLEEREAILKLHSLGKPFSKNVSWKRVAQRTVGFSGADLENMLNEAAILAARKGKTKITPEEIDEGALKAKLGPAKKRVLSLKDKKIAAYHESGHALVNWFLPNTDPVQKISIVSRGMALGFTLIPPEKDRPHITKDFLFDQIAVLMAGRAAEEIKFKTMTTGAANDIQNATQIAREMVVEYGMGNLGPLYFGPQFDIDQSRSFFVPQEISPQTQAKIDDEIRKIVRSAYQKAKTILKENKNKLDQLADQLAKKETLDRNDLKTIMKKNS